MGFFKIKKEHQWDIWAQVSISLMAANTEYLINAGIIPEKNKDQAIQEILEIHPLIEWVEA